MRIMIDTNVLISAILKPGSIPDIVLTDVCDNHELVFCDQIIHESYEVAKKIFPNKVDVLDNLFAQLHYDLVSATGITKIHMKDIKDQPILNAAISHNIDILVTGDKHFLQIDPEIIKILTPSEYKEKYIKEN